MRPVNGDTLPAPAVSRARFWFGRACVMVAGLLLLPLPARSAENDSPWEWDASATLDALRSSRARSKFGLIHLDAGATLNAERLFGWTGVKFGAEIMVDSGNKPNALIASLQGVNNNEVTQGAARLYTLWVERDMAPGWRVRMGLYDLNSEFYVTDASDQLIHPVFGIGAELAQTGLNGPSIFPNTAFGVRIKAQSDAGHYAQLAVLDGVPGDQDHPGRTVVRLSRRDGALVAGEAGWQQDGDAAPAHIGLGIWGYTQPVARLDGRGEGHSMGLYGLAQTLLFDRPDGRTTGFVRAGFTDARLSAIDAAVNAGVLIDRPLGHVGPVAIAAGVAIARLGTDYRAQQAAAGIGLVRFEQAFEFSARWQPRPALAVQPLVMRVRSAGGRPGDNTTLFGIRFVLAVDSNASP